MSTSPWAIGTDGRAEAAWPLHTNEHHGASCLSRPVGGLRGGPRWHTEITGFSSVRSFYIYIYNIYIYIYIYIYHFDTSDQRESVLDISHITHLSVRYKK